jgi:ABC-type uncharacterized transport system auxiliary subunit
VLACVGCFGSSSPIRSYYVLTGVTASSMVERPIAGLVRVRNLDAATIYEKFQFVVRRNPYELQYNEDNVWAVKPNRMVSDLVARALADSHRFTAVARELGELKPDYILGGDLHAIEVYDSDDAWFAHIALSLRLTRFSDGKTLYAFSFDERRPLPERTFAQAARAISELLSTAMDELLVGLEDVDAPRAATSGRETPPAVLVTDHEEDDESESPVDAPKDPVEHETIFVPERPCTTDSDPRSSRALSFEGNRQRPVRCRRDSVVRRILLPIAIAAV